MASQDTNSKSHPMVGTQLGQYKVLSVIGGGGMGLIFKARQETVDRDVVLKLLPPDLARDEVNVKRLEREAKALAKLNHPNIVTTYDLGMTPYQQAYIVMEFVVGRSLKEILAEEAFLPVPRALKVFLQITDAMKYANKNGIVHRDLKPHNVMLSDQPNPDFVKVLDFGIARLQQDSQNLTRAGEMIGSPLYMSPEQCMGEPIDQRSDVYSLGVMMFECLVGHVPFRGDNLHETVQKKCNAPIPRFKDVTPELVIPYALEDIVRHCLPVNPFDRFQSMDELKDALDAIAPGFLNAGGDVVSTGSVRPPALGVTVGQGYPQSATQDWQNQSGSGTHNDGQSYGGGQGNTGQRTSSQRRTGGQGRTLSRTGRHDMDEFDEFASPRPSGGFTFTPATIAVISLLIFLTLCTGLFIGLGVEYFAVKHGSIIGKILGDQDSSDQQNNSSSKASPNGTTSSGSKNSDSPAAPVDHDVSDSSTGSHSTAGSTDDAKPSSPSNDSSSSTTTTSTSTTSTTTSVPSMPVAKPVPKAKRKDSKPKVVRKRQSAEDYVNQTQSYRTHVKPQSDVDRWNNFTRRENRHPVQQQPWTGY